MVSKKITWPKYKGKKLIKDGTIEGVPFKEVWEQCQKWASQYVRDRKKTNPVFKEIMDEVD